MSITRQNQPPRIGPHSENTKKKISEKHKGNVPSNKGKTMSEEQKIKIRNTLLGKKHSEETKKKLSKKSVGNKARTGMKMSDEHKQKISLKMKESWEKRKKEIYE